MSAPKNWTIANSIDPKLPCQLFIEALEDLKVIVLERRFQSMQIYIRL